MKSLLAIIQEPKKSKHYLNYVFNFANDFNLDVKILYVYHSDVYTHSVDLIGAQAIDLNININEEKEKIKNTIDTTIEEVLKNIELKVQFESFIYSGQEIIAYKEFIKTHNIDLVLFKSNNDDGLMTIHSSNIDLIRQLDCPLLIIPDAYSYKSPNKIVYATDYKDSDIKTIKKLISFTRIFEPEIITLHITDNTDMHERVMKYGFKEVLINDTDYPKIDVKVFKEEEDKDLGEYVNEIAIRMNADFLILLKENYGFFERIFRISQAETIIQEANIPVWIFKS